VIVTARHVRGVGVIFTGRDLHWNLDHRLKSAAMSFAAFTIRS
jgi:hypothetical protein